MGAGRGGPAARAAGLAAAFALLAASSFGTSGRPAWARGASGAAPAATPGAPAAEWPGSSPAAGDVHPASPETERAARLWEQVRDAVAVVLARDPDAMLPVMLMAAEREGALEALAAAVAAAGGEVERRLPGPGALVARVPARRVAALVASPHLAAISVADRARLRLPGPASAAPPHPSQTPPRAPRPPLRPEQPRSSDASLEAIRAPQARALQPADGAGSVIAVIDTGADPSHPALQRTPAGEPKIVDWVDFSGEGDVRTVAIRPNREGELATPVGRYRLGRALSASGTYRFGLLREENLNPQGGLRGDLDADGDRHGAFGVLVADTTTPGVYDAVIVDADRDFDFGDDQILRLYRASRDVGAIAPRGRARDEPVRFVISRLEPDGSYVNVGFDGHGHGTQVASIAAGYPAREDVSPGVAPGARLMVLKALDSAGDGSWDRISEAMAYAAGHGADVISLSVAGAPAKGGEFAAETVLMSRLSRIHNVLFTVAAGNGGPGLGSSTAPGDAADTVIAAALVTPAMWQAYWGYAVPRTTLPDFSAAGPRRDGSAGPTITAPGAAFGAVPGWVDRSGYALAEGTSVAAPHVAGAAAVVLDLARQAGVPLHFQLLKRVLEGTASPLPGYTFAEQGWGALDLAAATRLTRALRDLDPGRLPPLTRIELKTGEAPSARGVMDRDGTTATAAFRLADPGAAGARLRWMASEPWVDVGQPSHYLPPAGARTLLLRLRSPSPPGLHAAVLAGYTGEGPLHRALELPVTVVHPWELGAENDYRRLFSGELEPGGRRRYFFRVPEGIDGVDITLRVPRRAAAGGAEGRSAGGAGVPAGRARLTVVAPDGHTVNSPGPIGAGSEGAPAADLYRHRASSPLPGVWEAVVDSAPDLSQFGLTETSYDLEVALSGILFPGGPLRLSAPEGTTGSPLRARVTAQDLDRAFIGRLVGIGFGPRPADARSELLVVGDGEAQPRSIGEVPPNATWLRVSLANPSPPGGFLDLSLWRFDLDRQAWTAVEAPPQGGRSHQSIELPNPLPGRYLVVVAASQLPAKRVEAQLRHEVLTDAGDLRLFDADRLHRAGERWSAELVASVPAAPGRYHGRIAAYDAVGRRLVGWMPVILDRSLRPIEVLASPRLRETAPLTLELRDGRTGELLPAADLWVEGRRYDAPAGRVALPTVGETPLDVVAEAANAERSARRVEIPSATADPSPRVARELEILRRKVEAQQRSGGVAGADGP